MSSDMLNGFDRNRQEIFDQAHFFLVEGLAVGHARQHPIKASHGLYASSNLLLGREEVFAGFLVAELRFVGEDGGKLPFEMIADVDHKRWTNVVIKRGVDDFERSMWRSAGTCPERRRRVPGTTSARRRRRDACATI